MKAIRWYNELLMSWMWSDQNGDNLSRNWIKLRDSEWIMRKKSASGESVIDCLRTIAVLMVNIGHMKGLIPGCGIFTIAILSLWPNWWSSAFHIGHRITCCKIRKYHAWLQSICYHYNNIRVTHQGNANQSRGLRLGKKLIDEIC